MDNITYYFVYLFIIVSVCSYHVKCDAGQSLLFEVVTHELEPPPKEGDLCPDTLSESIYNYLLLIHEYCSNHRFTFIGNVY